MWVHNSDNESALIHNTAHRLSFRAAGGDPLDIYTDGSGNDYIKLGSSTTNATQLMLRGAVTASIISASGAFIGNLTGSATSASYAYTARGAGVTGTVPLATSATAASALKASSDDIENLSFTVEGGYLIFTVGENTYSVRAN